MELKEISEKSKEMIKTFVDEIGLDGEYYCNLNETPLIFGKPKLNACGEFISPGSERLKLFLQNNKCTEKVEKILNSKGLILINKSYKQQEADPDLYVTLIHETLHANRNLLIFDSFRNSSNEKAFTYNNYKFEQNVENLSTGYADASQEILKGNIDNSKKTINSYSSKTSDELENIEFAQGKVDDKLLKQQIVDEALVELIAILSYKLYSDKQKNKEVNIWNLIEHAKDTYSEDDIGVICEILLKHHDFELFNWMLDPITYSEGDIHYDFFEQYTKNDKEILEKLYNYDYTGNLDISFETEIDAQNIKNIAMSKTAIEEMPQAFSDVVEGMEYLKEKNKDKSNDESIR